MGGRKLSLGSWHSNWPPASSAAPAAHTAFPAGGCSTPVSLATFCLPSREAAAAARLICVSRSRKGSWGCSPSCAPLCLQLGQLCETAGFESSFCTGLQALLCCESRAFNPKSPNTIFLGRKTIRSYPSPH